MDFPKKVCWEKPIHSHSTVNDSVETSRLVSNADRASGVSRSFKLMLALPQKLHELSMALDRNGNFPLE